MNGNCGTFTVFCILNHPASVVAHQQVRQQQCPCFDELQLWDLDCLLTACTRGICWTCTTGTSNTLSINSLQQGKLSGLLNWTKGNGLCARTGLSTTLTCTTTGMSITSPKKHSLTLCVPVSEHNGNIHHSCGGTEERHHPLSNEDCWNLSCMIAETSTPSTVPSICIPPWAGGVTPPSVVHTHHPRGASIATNGNAELTCMASEDNELDQGHFRRLLCRLRLTQR